MNYAQIVEEITMPDSMDKDIDSPPKITHEEHVTRDGGFSSNYYDLDAKDGEGHVEIEFCSVCGEHIYTRCAHANNSWNDEGTVLKCNLCGKDVT
jgi:hypothetical protein